jgi:hypothetical protein
VLEFVYQFKDIPNKLSVSLMDVYPDLCNQRVCCGKLRQGIDGNGELTHTDDADTELGDVDESDTKLSNGDDPFGRDRHFVGAIFEGDVG